MQAAESDVAPADQQVERRRNAAAYGQRRVGGAIRQFVPQRARGAQHLSRQQREGKIRRPEHCVARQHGEVQRQQGEIQAIRRPANLPAAEIGIVALPVEERKHQQQQERDRARYHDDPNQKGIHEQLRVGEGKRTICNLDRPGQSEP